MCRQARLEIRGPEVTGFVNSGLEAPVVGHGLAGLFPPDLTGYYDGAEVSVSVALELVRTMTQAADEEFWERVRAELTAPQMLLLEETDLRNAIRWHRLTENNLDTVHAVLGPRTLLTVWPDLEQPALCP
ncbi:hypothetical protein [Streptomyces sp. NPDC056405]|uniref:hypothetical protein n=1 Tax=Streptomyces sp. NPDC056405 TaxID=3345811 RepID=UPI0035D663B4